MDTNFASGLMGFVLLAAAPAQTLEWRIPAAGAVEYRREFEAAASEPQPTAATARSAATDQRCPDRYLHRCAPAPWVCQGELRADQRALLGQVGELRDVLRQIACDVSSPGSARGQFGGLLPFGDAQVSGTWTRPDADGSQELRARFTARLPSERAGPLLRQLCVVDADGILTGKRRFDAGIGALAGFELCCDLVVQEDKRAFRRIVVRDRWQLVAVRDNQDFDFRKRVAAAIRDGAAWVRSAIEEQQSFLIDKRGDDRNYGSGRLALGLLTLLHGHVPAEDPVVQKGFAELRKRRIDDAYSLAAALMALAALHGPVDEAARLREGGTAALGVLDVPEGDRKLAARWLGDLLECSDTRAAASELLRFNYSRGPRYDTSLQQYGLLGMWSAHRLGVELPKGAFAAAARHLCAVQCASQGSVRLARTGYDALREVVGTDAAPKAAVDHARARGFAYQEAEEPPFGSMTCAGISGLLLARAGMAGRGERDRALERQVDDAIRDGFAWLAENSSLRVNPGYPERADNHWYYWLYCLERSCELSGTARLQGRDWYYEGGLQLLAQQQPNGSFRANHASTLLLDSTCFAVLFLAKATAAVPVTGG